jgi:hypothetical protein
MAWAAAFLGFAVLYFPIFWVPRAPKIRSNLIPRLAK